MPRVRLHRCRLHRLRRAHGPRMLVARAGSLQRLRAGAGAGGMMVARRQLDLFGAPAIEPVVAGARRAIPRAAYACEICRSRCRCHDLAHVDCPEAVVFPCAAGCGRPTTRTEACKPGYCRACAHAPTAIAGGAWSVHAMMQTEGGRERLQKSGALSYTDALELGGRLHAAGARAVRLVEVDGPRPRARARPRAPAVGAGQLDMFTRKRKGRRR